MKLLLSAALAALAVLAFMAPGQARAQVTSPNTFQRPTVSPYLNLLRQGSPAAINYYGLVRPEASLYASVNQLNQGVMANQQGIQANQQAIGAMLTTGHSVRFMSYRQYFLNTGMQAAGQQQGQQQRQQQSQQSTSSRSSGMGSRGMGGMRR
jgi:hypothetical protein